MALEKMRGGQPQAGELAVVVGAGRSGLAASLLLRKRARACVCWKATARP